MRLGLLFHFISELYYIYRCEIEVRLNIKIKNIYVFFYGKNMKQIWMACLVIYVFFYDLFMICLWFLGFPLLFHWFSEGISGNLWYFMDFPQVFLKSSICFAYLHLFFQFFLGIFLEIINTNHKKNINRNHKKNHEPGLRFTGLGFFPLLKLYRMSCQWGLPCLGLCSTHGSLVLRRSGESWGFFWDPPTLGWLPSRELTYPPKMGF